MLSRWPSAKRAMKAGRAMAHVHTSPAPSNAPPYTFTQDVSSSSRPSATQAKPLCKGHVPLARCAADHFEVPCPCAHMRELPRLHMGAARQTQASCNCVSCTSNTIRAASACNCRPGFDASEFASILARPRICSASRAARTKSQWLRAGGEDLQDQHVHQR